MVLAYVPGTGMTFGFSNAPGASFTVYCATNLTAPINWQPIGSPTEISSGSYKFTDAARHQSVRASIRFRSN